MKEEKFTLGAEKQMVQRVGWSGGLTAPPKLWGRGKKILLRNHDQLSTSPRESPRAFLKNQEKKISLKTFTFKTGNFFEIW